MNIYIVSVLVFLLVAIGTKYLINWLIKQNILDIPNHRSNHTIATPRGGGMLIIAAIIGGYFLVNNLNFEITKLLLVSLFLAIVNFIDDRRGLSVFFKFCCQVLVAVAMVYDLQYEHLVLRGFVSFEVEKLIIALSLIWSMNCFNFMDGIDGFAASGAVLVVSAIIIVSLFELLPKGVVELSYLVGSACLGFLRWNWHRAKIFMGDSGSLSLGLIIGWLLLKVVLMGHLSTAMIMALYFNFDGLYTLFKRLFSGKNVLVGHSEHFYQKAVRKGMSHDVVVKKIIVANISLIGASIISLQHNITAITIAVITLVITIYNL